MTAPARLVSVAFSREASYGVGVAPVMLVPVSAPTLNDSIGWQRDDGWRGAPAVSYGHVVSGLSSKGSLIGPLRPDTIGWPLAGVLGDVTYAGGTVNTHTIAVDNGTDQQPPSYQVVLNDPTGQVSFPGCRFLSLEVALDPNELMTWSAELSGLAGVASAWSMPAVAAEQVVAGWRSVAVIGGTTETRVLSAQVKIARPVDPKWNIDGGLAPWNQRADIVTVGGDLLLVAASDAYRQSAIAGTLSSIDLSFSYGAGAALRSLKLHCSNVLLTSVSRTYGARWVELAVAFEADFNTTDVGATGGYSPIKATLKNAVASGVYA